MQRAGAAAAAEIVHRFADRLAQGVVVATGPGNNGGDGWVVAHALHAAGVRVRVVECMLARTPDALAERQVALAAGVHVDEEADALSGGHEQIVVDALIGTGMRDDEPLTGVLARAVTSLHIRQQHGADIVALDVPTGLDATSGLHVGAPRCALTLTFGTLKRGHLVARDRCGTIVVLDIGLGAYTESAGVARLATAAWFRGALPPIGASAHKGTRGKVAIIGGAEGMAGAVVLAARGALRSGAGMVKCVVAKESLLAVQQAEPAALVSTWPTSDEPFSDSIAGWADVLLIGPGLGRVRARELVERALRVFRGPVVLDADALNVFARDVEALAPLLSDRVSLLTPHPAEFARLVDRDVDEVLSTRFDSPRALAVRTGATVLLKGVPTVISSPNGETTVVAEGTPVLATGGSGDVLGGIAATLLAQTDDAHRAGALAAFAHGRAASLMSMIQVRGYTLDDVLAVLPGVWTVEVPAPRPPLLAELPAVGEHG